MKKFKTALLMLATFTITFSSCEDDLIKSELELDMSKSGSVEIYFYADLDKNVLGTQPVPDGTKVLFSIEYNEFNPDAVSGRWSHVAEIEDGKVTLESVPTVDDGVTLIIKPEEFIYAQGQLPSFPMEEITMRFIADEIEMTIYPDQRHYEEIVYDYDFLGEPLITVNRAFSGEAIFNFDDPDANGFDEFVSIGNPPAITNNPSISEVELISNDGEWEMTVPVQNGKFTADVPIESGFSIRFSALARVEDEYDPIEDEWTYKNVPYRYTWNSPAGGYDEDSPEFQNDVIYTTIYFAGEELN